MGIRFSSWVPVECRDDARDVIATAAELVRDVLERGDNEGLRELCEAIAERVDVVVIVRAPLTGLTLDI